MEYITKKMSKKTEPKLHEFQARYVLDTGEKLNDAKAMDKAIDYALEHLEEQRTKKKKYRLKDLCGFIKGGPKTNAAQEVDQAVYGI